MGTRVILKIKVKMNKGENENMNLCYREYKEVSPDPIFRVRVEELRKERGLSKSKLSKLSGLGRSTITEIETGSRENPTCITLIKLSKALNCAIDELIQVIEVK